MMRWIPIGAAMLLLTLAPACKRQQVQTGTAETTSATQAAMSKEDKEFMTKAAQGSMLEIAAGQDIAKRTTNADVKAFADRMVEDHSRLSDELKQLAAKKGLTPPTQMDKDHREDLDDIKKLSGPKLDKKYAEEMVDDHEDDVKEFTEASQKLKDPDVRAWAAKALPLLQSHLDQAKQLRAKIAPES